MKSSFKIKTNSYRLLLLYGLIDTNKNRSFPNLMIELLRVTTFVSLIVLLFNTLHFAFLTNNSKLLYKISFHFKSWIVVITYIYVNFKMNQINRILSQITSKQSVPEMNKLKTIHSIFITIWLIYISINAMVFIWLAFRDDKKFLIIAIIREFLWAIYGFGWITASVLFLTYICYSLHILENRFLKEFQFNKLSTIETSLRSLKETKLKFLNLQQIKESINENLGILPFLWFLELFASTCFRITQIAMENNSSENIYVILEYFYEFSLLCFLYLFFIFSISYYESKRPTINELLIFLNRDSIHNQMTASELFEKLLFVQQLNNFLTKSTYTAWNVFTIEKKFILIFLNSVAPFSVMFIQLLQQVKCN